MDDTYFEPARQVEAELKEKGSRFLAEVFVVRSEEEAEQCITLIRKREYDATHHCSAYRIGADASLYRFNDDGEPGGSAGLPILRQIEGRNLTNTIVVVTRYYGGTKLGTGGLARAYGDSASAALDMAGIKEVIQRTRMRVAFDYDDTSPALHCVEQFDIDILERSYSEETVLDLDVRCRDVEAFSEAYIEALGGRGRILES